MVKKPKLNGAPKSLEQLASTAVIFKRDLGKDLLNTLSRNVAPDTYGSVMELLANSHDADATRVDVKYDGKTLSVIDNGAGMTATDLQDFYRVGDSVKRNTNQTSSGRKTFGKFGVATLCLHQIAGMYELTTSKNGSQTQVNEAFEGSLNVDKGIVGSTKSIPEGEHGTSINMRELKFSKKTFDLDELRRRIGWSLRVGPSVQFQVYVNDELVRPKLFESARKFGFEKEGPLVGNMRGTMYLTKHPNPDSGIYLRVNGRAIGDPRRIINLDKLDTGIANRILFDISADGLESEINVQRSGFSSGPKYDEALDLIRLGLNEVRRYQEHTAALANRKGAESKRSEMVAAVYRKLDAAKIDEITAGGLQVISDSSIGDSHIAVIDQKLLKINFDHPAINSKMNDSAYSTEKAILHHVVQAIVVDRLQRKPSEARIWPNFLEEQRRLYASLYVAQTAGHKNELFENALYSPAEVSAISGMHLPSLRYAIDLKLVKLQNEEIKGNDFMQFEKTLSGLYLPPEFVVKHMSEINVASQITKLERIIASGNVELNPFVKRLQHGYAVEPVTAPQLAKGISQIDLREAEPNYQKAFSFVDDHYTLLQAAKSFSLEAKDVAQIIGYAKANNISLTSRTAQTYPLRGLVSALQGWRNAHG